MLNNCFDIYHTGIDIITDAQAYLEGVSAELLYGDEHLDVVAAEAGVDPAGHGELEAAEAAHEEVNTVLTLHSGHLATMRLITRLGTATGSSSHSTAKWS